MTEIEAVARKWGDSLAIIIPSDVVKKEHITANDTVHVDVRRHVNLMRFFGKLPKRKTAQQMKDEERDGWD